MRRPALLFIAALAVTGAYLLGAGGIGQGAGSAASPGSPTLDGSVGRTDLGFKGEIAPMPAPGGGGDGTAMIRTGSQTLLVADLDASITEAGRLAKSIGAILVGSSRGEGYGIYDANGALRSTAAGPATLSYRVPADKFEQIRSVFLPLGELLVENSNSNDVSASLRDLGARLTSLREAEKAYLALYGRATTVDEILKVQLQLDALRSEIESMAAQETALKDQVSMSSFTLTLQPKGEPIAEAGAGFDPGAIAADAVAALLRVGQSLIGALIYLGIFGLPLLVLVALVALIVRRIGRRSTPVGKNDKK